MSIGFSFSSDTGADWGPQGLLLLTSLRSLERIDLLNNFLDFPFDVRCRGANADEPLGRRLRVDFAVLSTGQFNDLVAAFTGFHDDVAVPSGISAALLGHEGAFRTLFDCLANHDEPSFLVSAAVMESIPAAGERLSGYRFIKKLALLAKKDCRCQVKYIFSHTVNVLEKFSSCRLMDGMEPNCILTVCKNKC